MVDFISKVKAFGVRCNFCLSIWLLIFASSFHWVHFLGFESVVFYVSSFAFSCGLDLVFIFLLSYTWVVFLVFWVLGVCILID